MCIEELWCLICHCQQYFIYIMVVEFYWWRKPETEYTEKITDLLHITDKLYHKMMYRVHLAWVGFELTTLVEIGTDYICNCKSNYHMIMTTTAPYIHRNRSSGETTLMETQFVLYLHDKQCTFFNFSRKKKVLGPQAEYINLNARSKVKTGQNILNQARKSQSMSVSNI